MMSHLFSSGNKDHCQLKPHPVASWTKAVVSLWWVTCFRPVSRYLFVSLLWWVIRPVSSIRHYLRGCVRTYVCACVCVCVCEFANKYSPICYWLLILSNIIGRLLVSSLLIDFFTPFPQLCHVFTAPTSKISADNGYENSTTNYNEIKLSWISCCC